jgi:hypothetical protein
MKIRSLLLSEMPADIQSIRLRQITLRWTVAAIILFIISFVVFAVTFRIFPTDDPLGQILYGLHDSVFLILRGELFAFLIYPFGFVVIFAIIFLIVFTVVPWLFAQSTLRGLYNFIWGSLIQRVSLHKRVLNLVHFTSRVRPFYRADTPRMLAQNQHERDRLELWLTHTNNVKPHSSTIEHYIAMLKLSMQLEKRVARRHRKVDIQLQNWHLAVLLFQLNEVETAHISSMIRLLEHIPLKQMYDETPATMPEPLKPSTLIMRLIDIISLYRHAPIQPNKMLNSVDMVQLFEVDRSDKQPKIYDVVTQVADWIESCTRLYRDTTTSYLQPNSNERKKNMLPPAINMPMSYPVIGQLILQMATHFALLTQQPQITQSLFDAEQALTLALDLAESNGTLYADENQPWLDLVSGVSEPVAGQIVYPYEIFGIIATLNGQDKRDTQFLSQILTEDSLAQHDKYAKEDKLINRMGNVS